MTKQNKRTPTGELTSKNQARQTMPRTFNSSWYLGGNHDVKLLTSVDGDLDPSVLNKVTAVPKDIGEIALSVESMVSHDYIVGDFETDILAQIATNTLVSQRPAVVAPPAKRTKLAPTTNLKEEKLVESRIQALQTVIKRSPSMESFSVPNPLADSTYKPVPNPLAVPITPPDSPVSVTVPIPVTMNPQLSKKRKCPAIMPKTKKAVLAKVEAQLIVAAR